MSLFCVKITSDRCWGKEEVSAYDYTIWESESEDTLYQETWEAQCEAASYFEPEDEDDWCEHVSNTVSVWAVPYDPTNPEHARCRSEWNLSVERPEHEVAVAAHASEQLQMKKDSLRLQIKRQAAKVEAEQKRLDNLHKELDMLFDVKEPWYS